MSCLSSLCCCLQSHFSEEERQPILGAPESARISHSPPNDSQHRNGRITVRRVGVPDLDQRFTDFEQTFNKQQEHYECMQEKWKTLMFRYRCAPDSSLSECLQKIKDEHDDHQISLQMKGFDFSLAVTPDDPMPDKLKRTQENIKELCQAVKAIVAVGPKLEEMINWLLKSEKSLTKKVKEEAKTYLESKRLRDNLRENLHKASRAKDLSPRYREEAGKLLNEVAQLSGVEL
ncbi:hypothetical protein PHYPO_G00132650 [Pangasianodon hypophthalmus]|uniref:Uncharacterized protein n=1 Tax=Pangasianodon hypophthalmus TaxID=310915 RepID=A0A5N5KKA5_PANHP|nr:uncharacterized protein si:ch73-345f18.3 [Pangasianodon hypophthalmus]KAB5530720.1 hypothetical protein PHYPO_G00132650 [Pangasianodon hypophthalmus]